MKRIVVVCSLMIAIFGLLTGCNNPFGGAGGEEPNLIVSLAGANARLSYKPSDADLKDINTELVLTKDGASSGVVYKSSGDKPFSLKVDPGNYTIELALFYKNGNEDVPYAKTAAPVPVLVEPNKIAQKTVDVYRSFVVSGVTVNPSGIHVEQGTTRQFTAAVTIDEALPQTVTWKVEAGVTLKSGTTINAAGELKIAADETDDIVLTITATSTLMPVSGAATVTVGEPTKPALTDNASVTVTGNNWVGQTLTANLAGTLTGTTTFQWKRDNSTNIGTDSNIYQLQNADLGRAISVVVSNNDYEGTITGALAETVLSAEPLPVNAAVTISSSTNTITVGSILTANAANFPAGTINYKWTRGTDTNAIGTNQTYTLVTADLNAVISVELSHANRSGVRTATTGAVELPSMPVNAVTISGTATVGQTLTAMHASLTASGTASYEWKRGSTSIGTNSATYTLVAADANQSITVTVSHTGYADSQTSAGVTVGLANLTGNITISPNTGVYAGTELTANYSGSESVTFQWNNAGGTISGATNNKYTPQAAGSYTVTVSLTNYNSKTSDPVTVTGLSTPVAGDYTFGNLTQTAGSVTAVTITPQSGKSPGTVSNIRYNGSTTIPQAAGSYPVTFDVAEATGWNAATLSAGTLTVSLPTMPANAVTISGTATVGYTLEAMHTSLTVAGTPSYQWKRGGANITPGGTAKTYTLVEADTNQSITVTVSHTGYADSQTSSAVTIYPVPSIIKVSITGQFWGGGTLTANPSGFSNSSSFSYVWKKADGTVVGNSQTYTPVAGEATTYSVTATSGSESATGYISVVEGNFANTFNVNSAATWTTAANTIRNGGEDKSYLINITADFSRTSDANVTFGYTTGINVTIYGNDKTITLTNNGNLLRIMGDQTVTMGGNLTLKGPATNNTALVYVITDGTTGSTFTMNDGAIMDNTNTSTSNAGGGVFVSSGTFTMNGGIITRNTSGAGGGVMLTPGTFTMNGGEISGNTASGNTNSSKGGGVYHDGGNFTMKGGVVSGNRADGTSLGGGGVCMESSSAIFHIENGTVYGSSEGALSNTAPNAPPGRAAFYGTAQYGTFTTPGNVNTWVTNGTISATDNTIRVVNGVQQ